MRHNINWRVCRIKRRMSQRSLAEVVRVSQPRIAQIEKGDEPSLILAARICAALDIHLNHFRNLSKNDYDEFEAIYHLNKANQGDNSQNIDAMQALIAFSDDKRPYHAHTHKIS